MVDLVEGDGLVGPV
jgi:hypothetical protein